MRRAAQVLLLLALPLLIMSAGYAHAKPQSSAPLSQCDAVIIHNAEQFNAHLDNCACAMQDSVLCVFKNTALISPDSVSSRSVWYDYSNTYKTTVYPQQIALFEFELKDNARLLAAHRNPQLCQHLSAREKQALYEAQRRIRSLIMPGMSDTDKFRVLHDDLIHRATYTREDKGDAADLLVDGRGTCEAYSRALWLLCRMANLPCHIVYGTAHEPHAWNLVCLENRWYHTDATWDDPVTPGQPNRHVLSHNYFLLSDEQIKEDHSWNALCLPAATEPNEVYFRKQRLLFNNDTALWKALSRAISTGEAGITVYMKNYGSDADFTQRLREATAQHPQLSSIRSWQGPTNATEGVVAFTFENSGLPRQANMNNLELTQGVIVETHRFLQRIDAEELQRKIRHLSDEASSWWKMLLRFLVSVWEVLVSWFE